MFHRFVEYREMQQLRKDHRAQQRRRQLFTFLGVLGTLLMVLIMIELAMPAKPTAAKAPEPTKSVQVVPAAESQETQELQDIQAFADAITKPLGTLTSDDLNLMDSKAKDPCYESNAMLPKDQMIQAISSCEEILK